MERADVTPKCHSAISARPFTEITQHFCNWCGVGEENPSLVDFVRNAEENSERELAERVGVLVRDFGKANEINGFAINSRNRNDLASSNTGRRFRPFAGFC